MNTHRRIVSVLMALFFSIFICGCGQSPIIIDYAEPHTFSMAEVAGQWIGFAVAAGDTCLSRLELRADGTGTLTQAYSAFTLASIGVTNVETMRFEIRRWDIATNNVLTCDFSLGGADASLRPTSPTKMTCNVTVGRLDALLLNDKGGFREKIGFLREKDIDDKLRVLRQ